MITSINEFKQFFINESITVKDPEFDAFIKSNADKIVKRTSKILPQLNKLFNGTSFIARGGYREGKRVGFWIENTKGDILLIAPQFKVLMEDLRNLARPYATLKPTHVKDKPTSVSIPPVKSIDPPQAVMSYDELRNMLNQKEYESGRFYIDFNIEKNRNDEMLFKLVIVASSKRGYPREAYMKALSVQLPSLPRGYEYTDRIAKDYQGKPVTSASIRSDDEYYDDRGYTDSEFGGEIYYDVKKTA